MGDSTPATKPHLPVHLIALIDSLTNIEFHKLTKKLLKERLEEIKLAIGKELAKRSPDAAAATVANGDARDQPATRPHSYANSSEPSSNIDNCKQRQKVVDKQAERVKSLAPNSKSSTATNSKSSALGLSKSGPLAPSFNDLLRIAEHKGDHRQTPDRYPNQRSLSPHKPESAIRTSAFTTASRAHSPPAPSRPRPRPSDPYPARANVSNGPPPRSNGNFKSNGISKSSRDDDIRTSSSSSKNGSSSLRREVVQSREESRIKKDSRKVDEEMPENYKKEPVKSARARKRDEEQKLEEIKRRRIEDENKRVELRNQALLGKKTANDQLKTIVGNATCHFSQGSTVLSCGRSSTSNNNSGRSADPRSEYRNAPRPKDPRAMMEREQFRERRLPGPNTLEPPRHRMHLNPYMDADLYSRPPINSRSRRYDDEYEDEDEDDMDDFIDDDGDEYGREEASRVIRDIYGYDKRRYRDEDDDDIEEASYAQIQKEEKRSERLGKLEDAEDMRKEAEHKRRKREALIKNRR